MTVRILSAGMGTAIIGALSFGAYQYYLLHSAYAIPEATTASVRYESQELRDKLKASEALNTDLQTLLQARQQEKETIGQQVQTLSTTVGTLDKLAHTDKELLEKYSSVFFLNENYIPNDLQPIDTSLLSKPEKPQYIIKAVLPHLTDLLKASALEHIPLQILSTYRSFGEQTNLKNSYKTTYGAGTANSFSADQGYSEHQLGTAVDFTSSSIGGALAGFDNTTSYQWLTDNAYRYGFNLSYPKGNTHFIFEPWHWRYVGLALAKKLHDEHKALYDLDQREINTYLVRLFD